MRVEQLAQALGVLSYTNEKDLVGVVRKQGVALIEILDAGGVRIWTPYARPRDVDEGTALIFLLARASGLRLDVGRCPACEERGGNWEWGLCDDPGQEPQAVEHGWTLGKSYWYDDPEGWEWSRPKTPAARPCPECSEPRPPVACKVCHGRGSQVQVINVAGRTIRQGDRVPLTVKLPAHVLPMFRRDSEALTFMGDGNDRPCHDCNETGKQTGPPHPTGRRILGAEAFLEAMARPGEGPYTERVDDDFGGHDIELWDPPEPGDQTVRDALAVHADRLQADGDPLGELLAAWIRGECQVCEGGKIHEWAHATPQGWKPVAPGLEGPTLPWLGTVTDRWRVTSGGHACRKMQCCDGHGTVLGALWEELDAMSAEWCERLEDATAS